LNNKTRVIFLLKKKMKQMQARERERERERERDGTLKNVLGDLSPVLLCYNLTIEQNKKLIHWTRPPRTHAHGEKEREKGTIVGGRGQFEPLVIARAGEKSVKRSTETLAYHLGHLIRIWVQPTFWAGRAAHLFRFGCTN
jgi:hypothetical protein